MILYYIPEDKDDIDFPNAFMYHIKIFRKLKLIITFPS